MLQASGEQAAADKLLIKQAVTRADKTLQALGFTKDRINEIRNALSTLLTDRSAFDRESAKAQRELAQLATERAEIEERARLGLISQHDAQHRLPRSNRVGCRRCRPSWIA